MKNIVLFVICNIVFSTVYGQKENYVLNPNTTKELIAKLEYEPIVYQVLVKKSKNQLGIIEERLFVGDLVASNSLSGSFIRLNNYVMMKRSDHKFLKHELVQKDMIVKFNISERVYVPMESKVLIKNIETDEYYYTEPFFLKRFDVQFGEKMQYRKVVMENKRKISVSRIDNIKYPIKQYEAMIKECTKLTAKLKVHRELSKTGNMTKTQIVDWKRDVIEAKLLNYRISEFSESYEIEKYANYINSNDTLSDNYDQFYEILKSANKYTGL